MSMTVCASTLARTYGISIESAPYEGTTVTIRTPRVPEDREGDYDKNCIKRLLPAGPGGVLLAGCAMQPVDSNNDPLPGSRS